MIQTDGFLLVAGDDGSGLEPEFHHRLAEGGNAAARELWTKSREIYAQLGAQYKVDEVQGLIDSLPD